MKAASKAFPGALAKARQPAKKLVKPVPFSVRDAFSRANDILGKFPALPHINRPQPVGKCLQRFALPLPVCQPQNRTRHAQPWKLGKMKSECLSLMRAQLSTRPTSPFSGRPQVYCVRFSSVEPDAFSDWAKVPVDCLKKLGLVVDDNPRAIELSQHWEPAPPKLGFCLIEVWSGKP